MARGEKEPVKDAAMRAPVGSLRPKGMPSMFNWFKRHDALRAAARHREQHASAPAEGPATGPEEESRYYGPLPVGVCEGNSQDDWSMWEDSMSAMETKLKELMPVPPRFPRREANNSAREDIDAAPRAAVQRKA